ncbi:unnamed protein product [Parascedosporium putredinis]|uniref:Uncharacterized protein n=1 Tax=Parascedosporium putredinis TaxID=1442378 RepID=A0A9P1H2S3_9PEZI|nr:unnamed protein product [Parascedosporium putredinis]CAI7993976.1 unnamed protein product [Parascedosporium putredinis]
MVPRRREGWKPSHGQRENTQPCNHGPDRETQLSPRLPLFETQKPYIVFPGFFKFHQTSNLSYTLGPEQLIKDARACPEEFSLDKQGFIFRSWSPSPISWDVESHITGAYLPRSVPNSPTTPLRALNVYNQPDQSPAGVLDRLRLALPDEDMDELLGQYRVQIFNVWRPISSVVEDWPLAVCDARTTGKDDVVELEFVTPELVRLSYLAKWNENYKFYYLSHMTNKEVCIFKIFDSAHLEDPDASEATMGCLHTAFKLKSVPPEQARESIEVRLFVFSSRD